eukprot:SAG31_NODE_39018_length_291_cov_1.078125_1_plen_38_part_01
MVPGPPAPTIPPDAPQLESLTQNEYKDAAAKKNRNFTR